MPRRISIDMTVADFRQRFGLTEDQLPDDVSEEQLKEFLEANAPPGGNASFSVPAGMVLVDEGNFERLQEETLELQDQERDHLIEAAIAQGKIPPARREHYQMLFESDPDGTRNLIASLAEDAVPVKSRATAAAGFTSGDAYPAGWLPEVNRQQQVVRAND